MEKLIALGIALMIAYMTLGLPKNENNADKPQVKKITYVIVNMDPN